MLETARSIPQTYRFTLRFLSGLTFDFLFALRGSSDIININATISGAFLAQIVRIATHIQYQLSVKNNGFSNYSDDRVMTYNIASIVPIFVLSISFERFEKSVRRYTTAQELCSHWSAIKLFILAQALLLLSGRQTCASPLDAFIIFETV